MTAIVSPAVIALSGDIDIATAPAIRGSLLAALGAGSIHLVIDMAGVTFLDCAGIGALIAAASRARTGGGSLALRGPPLEVLRLLNVLGLDGALPVIPAHGS